MAHQYLLDILLCEGLCAWHSDIKNDQVISGLLKFDIFNIIQPPKLDGCDQNQDSDFQNQPCLNPCTLSSLSSEDHDLDSLNKFPWWQQVWQETLDFHHPNWESTETKSNQIWSMKYWLQQDNMDFCHPKNINHGNLAYIGYPEMGVWPKSTRLLQWRAFGWHGKSGSKPMGSASVHIKTAEIHSRQCPRRGCPPKKAIRFVL